MAEKPVQIKELKSGSYVTIDGEPCKVLDVVKSKPGKHGATKVRMEAMGIFDNKRRVILKPSSAIVDSPIIEKKKAQIISISGDTAQLMDLDTYETFECTIPEEFKGKLEPGIEIGYWQLGSRILIKEKRS
jgi:translation initiation factor 5A